MSVEEHQTALSACYSGSQDPIAQQCSQTANQYTEMFKVGQISKEEYIELMEDIQRQSTINMHVHNQEVLTYMNTAITGLITLAKLV